MFEKIKNAMKRHTDNCVTIYSPLEGEAVPISEVNDPVFREELVGRGVAVRPSKGRAVAPADGEVSMMFKTGHAVVLVLANGVELLIHVGLDTVNLEGTFFKIYVRNNDRVRKGDLLIEFDIESIKSEGYDLITPVVVTNHENFKYVETMAGHRVAEGDELISVRV
ncbi:MAG: PTS glucose transporter subunit IIA [Synergistaceae bacterium]|nr:PTS glucose transporter subunit IIA [Synergistaceae bacterium]